MGRGRGSGRFSYHTRFPCFCTMLEKWIFYFIAIQNPFIYFYHFCFSLFLISFFSFLFFPFLFQYFFSSIQFCSVSYFQVVSATAAAAAAIVSFVLLSHWLLFLYGYPPVSSLSFLLLLCESFLSYSFCYYKLNRRFYGTQSVSNFTHS